MLLSMYRITLTDDQRQELRERTRQPGIAPSLRDRLETVRLCDAGWSVPKIALHLGSHENTVRAWVKGFMAAGFDALSNKPRGGDTSDVTPAMLETVRTEITTGSRTWSASEVADWVALHHGVRISPGGYVAPVWANGEKRSSLRESEVLGSAAWARSLGSAATTRS